MTRPATSHQDSVMDSPLPTPRDHITAERTRAVLRIQQTLLAGAREALADEGVQELLHPVIGPVTDPGTRGAKQVHIDYYGHDYTLMTSSILYKQTSLLSFDSIFLIAPNVRLEPVETSTTHRHLAEFHQIDVEIGGATREDAMGVAERLVRRAVTKVATECVPLLEVLDRDPATLLAHVANDFGRRTHTDVVDGLNASGYAQPNSTEIEWEAEELISRAAERPFFITDYPTGSRGFYDRVDPQVPTRLLNFDLIAPEGCGELCSGSEREFEYDRILTRIRETGEDPDDYGWYLDVVREGIPNSAGFGIGLERLTRWVAGLDAAWQAAAYPKLPGVMSP